MNTQEETEIKKSLEIYMAHILEYNKKVNIISRQVTESSLEQLINESLLLETYVLNKNVIDAGSGNGLLGIPIAILNPQKNIILVESRKKKVVFLELVKKEMDLKNITIYSSDIRECIKKISKKPCSLVARGFPGFNLFIDFLKIGLINEVILITSKNKIKKNEKHMVNVKKLTYNVPFRNELKILKMENVSRETSKQKK